MPWSTAVLEVPLHQGECTVLQACEEFHSLSVVGHLVVGAHQGWDLDIMEPLEELILQ